MVMSRNIDFDDVIEMTEGEASVMDPAFSDEDIVESGQALEMMENTQPNPRNSERIPWQALRLPGARTSERGRIERFVMAPLRKLVPGYSPSSEIRSSPFAYLISAKLWTQYINNMDAQDFGAELNAAVSMEERASLYLFAEEWRNDVAHTRFKTRLIDDPSVNVGNEVAKGQIVYDVLTGAIRQRGGQANTQYNRMFRLAMDILQSIRMRYYNYYSVNLLHRDEGSNVYEEFLSRYVPMEAHEVAIISEIEGGIAAHGRAYASQTTSPVTDPVQNFALMQRAVESYSIGDTRTARSALGLLLGAPISYRSSVAYSVNADVYGRPQIVREGGLVMAKIATKVFKESGKKGRNRVLIAKGTGEDGSEITLDVKNTGEINNKQNELFGATFIEVKSFKDPTPLNYLIFPKNKDGSIQTLTVKQWGEQLPNLVRTAQSAQETSENTKRRRGNVRGNPVRHNMPLSFNEQGKSNLYSRTSTVLSIILNTPNMDYVLEEIKKIAANSGGKHTVESLMTSALQTAYVRQRLANANGVGVEKAFADAEKVEDLMAYAEGVGVLDDAAYRRSIFAAHERSQTTFDNEYPKLRERLQSSPEDDARFNAAPGTMLKLQQKPRGPSPGTTHTVDFETLEEAKAEANRRRSTFGSRHIVVKRSDAELRVMPPSKRKFKYYVKHFFSVGVKPKGTVYDTHKPTNNPVAVGAGQHFFIQVLPKSRMSFTAKQKKMAKSKRAKTPMVGTAGRDSTGFHDIFGGLEKAGYIAWKGTDKKTGKAAPWMIQLPKKRGKRGSIAFKAKRVTKDGKSYKTIRPFTKDRQVLKAWDKFTKLYGEPIFAENKNKPNLFRIARKGRGTFYNRK